jgi:hypothetical protein
MIIKSFKLFESSIFDDAIWRLTDSDWSAHGGSDPEWALKKGIKFEDVPIEKDFTKYIKGHDFVQIEKDNYPQYQSIHFTKPKRVPVLYQVSGNLTPADVYYTIRIYQHPDEWFLFQWFGEGYATQEHMENYYKKYPHSGPGGKNHTYFSKITGKEELCYQPAMYKGPEIHVHNAETFGCFYLCDQDDSVITLLEEFQQFLDKPEHYFKTDYPKLSE